MTGEFIKGEDHYKCREVKAERDQLRAELEKLRKDVDMLVEALEEFGYGLHQTVDGEYNCSCSQCRFIRMRNAALAAHRKQGDG